MQVEIDKGVIALVPETDLELDFLTAWAAPCYTVRRTADGLSFRLVPLATDVRGPLRTRAIGAACGISRHPPRSRPERILVTGYA